MIQSGPCSTMEKAEECLDEIMLNNHLDRKRIIQNEHTTRKRIFYENSEIRMCVELFPDNWHGDIKCYSFKLIYLHSKDEDEDQVEGFICRPYASVNQGWRKKPMSFAEDISQAIQLLHPESSEGRLRGIIYGWNDKSGYTKTKEYSKIFVSKKDIPVKFRDYVRVGAVLRFNLVNTQQGIKAENIKYIGNLMNDDHMKVMFRY